MSAFQHQTRIMELVIYSISLFSIWLCVVSHKHKYTHSLFERVRMHNLYVYLCEYNSHTHEHTERAQCGNNANKNYLCRNRIVLSFNCITVKTNDGSHVLQFDWFAHWTVEISCVGWMRFGLWLWNAHHQHMNVHNDVAKRKILWCSHSNIAQCIYISICFTHRK